MDFITSSSLIMGFIIIYFVLIQTYTILLRMTGLPKEKATFQAISLLTNCGYTTSESEIVTMTKMRRRIALATMITGYSFSVIIVSLLINMFNSLNNNQVQRSFGIFVIILIVFLGLIIAFKLPFVQVRFEKLIQNLATAIIRKNNGKNIVSLIDNYGKDAVCEIIINRLPKFLEDKSIFDSKIKNLYGLNILILNREGRILSIKKETMLQVKDSLVIFGPYSNIKQAFLGDDEDVEAKLEKDDRTEKNVLKLIDNYGKEAMVEIKLNTVPQELKDTKLSDSNIRENYDINIVMLKHGGQSVKITKDTIISLHDTIVVLGQYSMIKKVFANDKKTEKSDETVAMQEPVQNSNEETDGGNDNNEDVKK